MYQTERDIIQRELEIGIDTKNRLPEVEEKIQQKEELLASLNERWEKEKALVERILGVRSQLQQKTASEETSEDDPIEATDAVETPEEKIIDTTHIELQIKDNADSLATESLEEALLQDNEQDSKPDHQALLAELHQLQEQLVEMQGDTPLVLPTVNAQAIASVISDWTGIPMGSMVKDELNAVLNLGETLGKRVL
jgi:type VI secretion system protein VasG